MRIWRALGISILLYYLLGLMAVLVAIPTVGLYGNVSLLPPFFVISYYLITIALTFGCAHWYFRSHERHGLQQGLFVGLFLVFVHVILDVVHGVPGPAYVQSYLVSYFTPFVIGELLLKLGVVLFVADAHGRHRGSTRHTHKRKR
jgi:hypothetical protein